MKSKNDLKVMFLQAYHNPDLRKMARGILDVLDEINLLDNHHWQWINRQMHSILIDRKSTDELPVMLYGMIYEAFNQLLDSMEE